MALSKSISKTASTQATSGTTAAFTGFVVADAALISGAMVADFDYRIPLSNPEIPVEGSRVVDEPVTFVGSWDSDHRVIATDGSEIIDASGLSDSYLIHANGGNDTVYGGRARDVIRGGDGNDKLYGYRGNDEIAGGADNDYIDGGYDNDRLFGEAGNDTLIGNLGDDLLSGGSGNDSLSGGSGTDRLLGGWGNDVMDGGTGNDTLIGGRGGDVMTGGAGRDMFVFESVQDSLKLWGKFDTITDFQQGYDKLDFSKIDANEGLSGDQAFQMVTYTGPNQVLQAGQMTVWFDYELGKTIIEANVDGDASNEFHLELNGNVLPNAGDMIM